MACTVTLSQILLHVHKTWIIGICTGGVQRNWGEEIQTCDPE